MYKLRIINLVFQVLQEGVIEARLLVDVNAINYFPISALQYAYRKWYIVYSRSERKQN